MSFTVIRPFRLYLSSTTSSFSTRCSCRIFSACFERGADGDGDQIFLRHDPIDGNVEASLKAQIAISEDADEPSAVFSNRYARDFVFAHHFERVGNFIRRMHGDGVDNHSAFRALYFIDFVGLLVDGQVAMNDAEASLLGQGDGHVRFGDGIHGGADDGDVESDIAREVSLRAGLRGNYVGARGEKKNIVKSKSFGNRKMDHRVFEAQL